VDYVDSTVCVDLIDEVNFIGFMD